MKMPILFFSDKMIDVFDGVPSTPSNICFIISSPVYSKQTYVYRMYFHHGHGFIAIALNKHVVKTYVDVTTET